MSLITRAIPDAKGDETILSGLPAKIIKINSINVTKATGAYSFALIFVYGTVETVLWSENVDEGGSILDTTPFEIDQTGSLKIDATPGVDVTIIGTIL